MPMSTSYLSSIQLNRAPVDVDPSTLKDVPIMTLHVSPILEQASIGKRSTNLTRRGIRFRVKVMWCLGQGLPSSLLLDDLLLSLSLSLSLSLYSTPSTSATTTQTQTIATIIFTSNHPAGIWRSYTYSTSRPKGHNKFRN
jgi:hypothetical protein